MPSSLPRRFLFALILFPTLTFAGCGEGDVAGPSGTSTEPLAAAAGSGGLVDFFGPIEGLTRVSLTIEGRTFVVNDETHVFRQGAEVSYGVLAEGDTVAVKAKLNRNGAWVAHEIRLRNETPLDGKLTGRVDLVSPPTLMVAGRLVQTNSGTQFTGKGEPRSLDDVRAGYLVTVTGFQGSDGTVTATKIRVESKS